MSFEKIAIVGTGALGGFYGAMLARIGRNVRFLARSDFQVLAKNGLHVRLPNESFTVHPVNVFHNPADIGACDLVIVTMKATGNHALSELLPPLLHETSTILTLENGLGSDELLASLFGAQRIVGGLCFICVNRTAPGEVHCTQSGSISFAEFGRPAGERVRQIAQLYADAGIRTDVGDDLAALRWKKLVWNIPFNGLSIAAGGIPTDRILENPELENEVRALMREVIEGAAKLGHAIPFEFIDRLVDATRPMGAYKPSSLIDYLGGLAVEVEAIWGEPLRRATAAGADLPRLKMLYGLLSQLTRRES